MKPSCPGSGPSISQPDYLGAHYNLMTAYRAIGDRESAMREYARIKDLDPDYAARLNNPVHTKQ